jgi:hypothetical protein
MRTHIHRIIKVLILLIAALSVAVSTQAANYDGTYNGLADGFAECPAIPPYVPPIFVYSPPAPFTFTIQNGVLSTGGTVDNFGNVYYQFPAGGATATITGRISYTGYVTNGRVSISGLPAGCTAGGTWSAQPANPPPVIVPPIQQFPAPYTVFSSVNTFTNTNPGFSADTAEYFREVGAEAKPLVDPSSIHTFLKNTSGPAADIIDSSCDWIGFLQASAEGKLSEWAWASVGLITPKLPISEEWKKGTEAGLLIKTLAGLGQLATAEEKIIALLVEANVQVYQKGVVPALRQVADDPPDPHYQVVAAPDPVAVPPLPSTGNRALDAALSKSYYDALLAQAHLGAVNTAFNRYSSAYAAGDATSATLQLEALLDNLTRYNREMQAAAADLKALQPLLQNAGVADKRIDTQGLANIKNYIRTNGLPASVMELLTYFGFTSDQIQTAVTAALADNPSTTSTLSGIIDNIANSSQSVTTNPPAHLYNISTRGFVGTGDNILDGGFIIEGAGAKTVMVRAIGPELTQYGVSGVLADPMLDLHDGSGAIIASNDDWQHTVTGGVIQGGQVGVVQNTGTLVPADTREAALVVTLSPGNYTAVVHGKNNTTGVALVEVYDLSPGSNSLLHNLSTRGFVQTGDNILDGGFIIKGPEEKTVIVRAIGPELTQYGVPSALADPTLELHDGSGALIASNDNWQHTIIAGIITADQTAAIQNSGHVPGDSSESAIIATLRPGNYTAIVRGKNNTTGVSLVEVYDLN